MAPTNLTDILGDFDREAPVSFNPLVTRSEQAFVPTYRNPAVMAPISVLIVVFVAFLGFLTFMVIYGRRERRRLTLIHSDMRAAARYARLEGGVRSDDDGMIMVGGIVYHYNYRTKRYDAVIEPRSPHFDSPSSGSVAEAAHRMMMLKFGKLWRTLKVKFSRQG